MAKYLWTSQTVGTGATASAHIAKYCYNAPGNWRVFNEVTKVWGATTGIPKNRLDHVYIGWEYDTGELGRYPTTGISYSNGWTHAKNPLLFGGFHAVTGNIASGINVSGNFNYSSGMTAITDPESGNLGVGVLSIGNFFYHVGVTNTCGGSLSWEIPYLSQGASFQYNQFPYNQLGSTSVLGPTANPNTAYPFPYLGGGISGEIAEWCANRDGLTVGDYVVQNYPGFRDPKGGLNLSLESNSNLHLQDLRIAGLAGNTLTHNPFMGRINITNTRAFLVAQAGGTGATASGGETVYYMGEYYGIRTNIHSFNGSGFELNGGYHSFININYMDGIVAFGNFFLNPMIPRYYGSGGIGIINYHVTIANRGKRYEDLVDHGVLVTNATVRNCFINNSTSVKLKGGDYSHIEINNVGYAPRSWIYRNFGLSGSNPIKAINPYTTYTPSLVCHIALSASPPVVLANNWDWAKVAWIMRGITNSALDGHPDYIGPLDYGDTIYGRLFERGTLQLNFRDVPPTPTNPSINAPTYEWYYSEPGNYDARYNIRYPGNTFLTESTRTYGGIGIDLLPSPMDAYDATQQRSRVIIGDPDDPTFQFGNTGTYDPFGTMFQICRINNTVGSLVTSSATSNFVPWNLEFISGGRIGYITNYGGIIKPHEDIPSDAIVRIGEIKQYKNATTILNTASGNANIRVGLLQYAPGFSGSASGAYFQGGIKSGDYSNNRIRGTNLVSWGTGIDTGYNVRQAFAGEVNGPGATFTIRTDSI